MEEKKNQSQSSQYMQTGLSENQDLTPYRGFGILKLTSSQTHTRTQTLAAHMPGRVPHKAVWSENIYRADGGKSGKHFFQRKQKNTSGACCYCTVLGRSFVCSDNRRAFKWRPRNQTAPLEVRREGPRGLPPVFARPRCPPMRVRVCIYLCVFENPSLGDQ